MKKTFATLLYPLVAILSILFSACSKESEEGGLEGSKLPGHIYHQYTTDVKKLNMQTGVESTFFSYSAYSTVGWGLSRDGTLRIITSREAGVYDRTRFQIVNTASGTIEKEFDYIPLHGNSTNNFGQLSFDKSLILIEPDFHNGIVLLDTDGNIKLEMSGINDETFTQGDEAIWLPDNGILVTFKDRYILRADPPYTNLILIKEMNYEKWGNIRVSNNGQKISMYIGNHIYMMDINGDHLVQVTESNDDEAFAEFSPDDKYLLVASDYFHAPASGNSHWYLKIIPADGKKYNLDSSPEVIPVIPKGENSLIKANKVTLWRP
ncbi:MAG TPA: hypothetical protein PKA53_08940 [Sphingobacterium sp.]|nr:hypothetical protein [Sphingobacterium sp.]